MLARRFTRWLVLEERPRGKNGDRVYLCQCDCGRQKAIPAHALKTGRSKSCGCLRGEQMAARLKTHGMKRSAEYAIWNAMIGRCTRPNDQRFDRYGGRGIRVCDEWRQDFAAFYNYVGPRPSPQHSVDRIDNNGHYEPGNVRWATRQEQAVNRQRQAIYEYQGERVSLMGLAKRAGIRYATLRNRVVNGMPIEQALTKPVDSRPRHRAPRASQSIDRPISST